MAIRTEKQKKKNRMADKVIADADELEKDKRQLEVNQECIEETERI